jgi:hypothetical protein
MTKNAKTILIVVAIFSAISLSVAMPFVLIIALEIKDTMVEREFLAAGKRGKAKILKIADRTKETTKGTFPRAKLRLEVSVTNYPTYQVETTKSIPVIHAPRIQPGLIIDVLVDPEQPNNEERIKLLLEE